MEPSSTVTEKPPAPKLGTEIWGASDDLIVLEGDVSDELDFYCDGDEKALLVFSDGTAMTWLYGESGIWKVDILNAGPLFESVEVCTDEDADPHSDVVTLKPGAKRAWFAKEWEPVRG